MTTERRTAPQAARDDYRHYVDACDLFSIHPALWPEWWERYATDYTTTTTCATCKYWQAVSNDQCEACAESCGTGVA